MRICHKFVKELFIFVMALAQIERKKVLDEFRSQFAVFATQYTSYNKFIANQNRL